MGLDLLTIPEPWSVNKNQHNFPITLDSLRKNGKYQQYFPLKNLDNDFC